MMHNAQIYCNSAAAIINMEHLCILDQRPITLIANAPKYSLMSDTRMELKTAALIYWNSSKMHVNIQQLKPHPSFMKCRVQQPDGTKMSI